MVVVDGEILPENFDSISSLIQYVLRKREALQKLVARQPDHTDDGFASLCPSVGAGRQGDWHEEAKCATIEGVLSPHPRIVSSRHARD